MTIKDIAEYIHHETSVMIFKDEILLEIVMYDFICSDTYKRYSEAEIFCLRVHEDALQIDI